MDKVKEARDIIKAHDLENATANQKLFFLFLKRWHITEGLSLMEIALILHPDETEIVTVTDKKTGQVSQISRPTRESWQKTKEEVKIFRWYCWEKGGIIFFCGTDPATGAQLYFNMNKDEFMERYVMKLLDRIARGAKGSKNKILKWIKLPPELKKQLIRNAERQVHQEIMESKMREMKNNYEQKKKKNKKKKNQQEEAEQYVQ